MALEDFSRRGGKRLDEQLGCALETIPELTDWYTKNIEHAKKME